MTSMEFLKNTLNRIFTQYLEAKNSCLEKSCEEEQLSRFISRLFFEAKLLQVRDYNKIWEKGAFMTEDSAYAALEEGLISRDDYEILKSLEGENPKLVSPFFFAGGFLTSIQDINDILSYQAASKIIDHVKTSKETDKYSFIIRCLDSQDFGYRIRNYCRSQLRDTPYKFFSPSPYVKDNGRKIVSASPENTGKGIPGLPEPECTSTIFVVSNEINFGEEISNTIKTLRNFGYENTDIVAVCLIYHGNPVGEERLKRNKVKRVLSLAGREIFDKGVEENLIGKSQREIVYDFLKDPSEFIRRISPALKK